RIRPPPSKFRRPLPLPFPPARLGYPYPRHQSYTVGRDKTPPLFGLQPCSGALLPSSYGAKPRRKLTEGSPSLRRTGKAAGEESQLRFAENQAASSKGRVGSYHRRQSTPLMRVLRVLKAVPYPADSQRHG